MATPMQTAVFFTQLEAEKLLIEKFISLLKEEQLTLVKGGRDELSPVTTAKTKLVEELAQLSDKRTELMVASGISLIPQELTEWIAQQNEQCRALWATCLDLAKQAKSLNNTNGRLIAERLSNNQAAIQTLMAEANQPATYGRDGQTRTLGHGRTLGSA